MKSRSYVGALVFGALTAGGLALAVPTPASAAPCTWYDKTLGKRYVVPCATAAPRPAGVIVPDLPVPGPYTVTSPKHPTPPTTRKPLPPVTAPHKTPRAAYPNVVRGAYQACQRLFTEEEGGDLPFDLSTWRKMVEDYVRKHGYQPEYGELIYLCRKAAEDYYTGNDTVDDGATTAITPRHGIF